MKPSVFGHVSGNSFDAGEDMEALWRRHRHIADEPCQGDPVKIDAEETAHRLAGVFERTKEFIASQGDPETARYNQGSIDAYDHCAGVLRNFLEAHYWLVGVSALSDTGVPG